ncbi:hypothetical protein [Streptococcus moroccensis]|uniref:Uncharacterized protein n=1 Tax=Streptococcus moroccensis TaxID=1451356 RepID=A0ABT9YSE6_9STRE|nr:hypothetical protein [Streptococcus moroccensis]MDQ0222910.1 hypothetical protein [Streptococcus moroccensis]
MKNWTPKVLPALSLNVITLALFVWPRVDFKTTSFAGWAINGLALVQLVMIVALVVFLFKKKKD